MNYDEWHYLILTDKSKLDFTFRDKAIEIRKSLQYNQDPNAVVIHHLRDTEEQRKYNDTYYERWGFNEDGSFEYGKYVIFVTSEEHGRIHSISDETRKKISDKVKKAIQSNPNDHELRVARAKKVWDNPEYKAKRIAACNTPEYKKRLSENTKKQMQDSVLRSQLSNISKELWQNKEYREKTINAMKASMTDERREQIRLQHLGKSLSEEHRKRLSEGQKNRPPISDETRHKLSESSKKLWQNQEYRESVLSDEANKKRAASLREYNKNLSDEQKAVLIKKRLDAYNAKSQDEKDKIVSTIKASWTAEKRAARSVEYKEKLNIVRDAYKSYKQGGGDLSWNDFQKFYWESHNKNTSV